MSPVRGEGCLALVILETEAHEDENSGCTRSCPRPSWAGVYCPVSDSDTDRYSSTLCAARYQVFRGTYTNYSTINIYYYYYISVTLAPKSSLWGVEVSGRPGV